MRRLDLYSPVAAPFEPIIVGVALPLALRSRWHSFALGDNAAVKILKII